MRSLLGHCLYRRVVLWIAAGLAVLFLILNSGERDLRRDRLLDLVHSKPYKKDKSDVGGIKGSKDGPQVAVVVAGTEGSKSSEDMSVPEWREDMPHWKKYKQ